MTACDTWDVVMDGELAGVHTGRGIWKKCNWLSVVDGLFKFWCQFSCQVAAALPAGTFLLALPWTAPDHAQGGY